MNNDHSPLLSIIIVNYNEEQFIASLLESIQKFEPTLSKEILILDNHSQTDIEEKLANRFENVSVIKEEGNDGFGRTNNKGIRMAKGKYVLLLNPDTLLESNCISACIHYFESHLNERIGAISCRLQSTDGSLQKSFFQLASSIRKTLQLNPIYIKLFGGRIKRETKQADEAMHEQISDAPWLCGAFLLLNREILLKEHFLFDEDFFLYSEDCELGYRMRKKGYALKYLPEQYILHFGGGSMPFLKRFEQLTISEWLCTMKVHGKFYFLSNQLLLLSNLMLDDLLFQKNVWQKRVTFHDKREKIIRRKLWQLWRGYTFIILLQYHSKPSSAKEMLKYPAL